MDKVKKILRERNATHGDFGRNATTTQALKQTINSHPGWENLTAVQREALDMVCTKIGRILSGNAAVADHWLDIQGYCGLVLKEIEIPALEDDDIPF